MKKTGFFITFLLFFAANAIAGLQVQMSYCTFYSPGSNSYVEVYLSFIPNDIKYVKTDNGYYGEIDVTYTFNKGDEIYKEEQFVVQTPLVKDTLIGSPPFVSQHRIFLGNGDYDMTLNIQEKNSTNEAIETTQKISLIYTNKLFALSDIELFQSSKPSKEQNMFQKNGYEIIPYAYDIVPQEMNQIGFYAELYNADIKLGLDSAFLITYYLEGHEDGIIIKGFKGYSR